MKINENIAILIDSACDIDEKKAKELNLHVLRMPIVIDGKEYLESIDINSEELHEMLSNGKFAKTSQVTLGSLVAKYDELLEKYDYIIHIPLSSGLSGMYQTSMMCIKDPKYKDRIAVVDAKFACYPIILLCEDVKKLIAQGKTVFEIKDIIEKEAFMDAIIIPKDINYLKLGGRISPAAASLANLLKIVPILLLKDGKIDVYGKVRTEKRAIETGFEPIVGDKNFDEFNYMVIHDHRMDTALEIKQKLESIVDKEVMVQDFGPVILSHTGPGCIAYGRIKKIVND